MAPASTPRWSRPCRSWTPRTRSKGKFFGEHFGDSAVEDETGSSDEDSMDQWTRQRSMLSCTRSGPDWWVARGR